ncbi:zf-HC2 domain-containing protein [Bacillus mycoides]|uniref:zf-HC2 domain-containing protein n=1 Tax=Bacillus mycoides TaxID=1405 RepID=UPI003F751ABA
MNCYDVGFIQAYMDGELPYETRKEFTKHLDTCNACQDSLLEISKLNQWENVMLEEEIVHSSKEIKIDVDQAWKAFESRAKLEDVSYINQKPEQKKGLFTNMNKKSKRFMYIAVAVAGLFSTAMIPQVRVAATDVASYFSNAISNDTIIDEGRDVTKGQFIPLDEKITDQGVTVYLKELYVADARISVHYKIEKENGNVVPFEFDTTGLQLEDDGKVNGQQEKNPEYKKDGYFGQLAFIQGANDGPFELKASGEELKHIGIRFKDRPEGVITFIEGPEGKNSFKQPLTLDINISRIGKVAGSWKGQLQIDPTKLKK